MQHLEELGKKCAEKQTIQQSKRLHWEHDEPGKFVEEMLTCMILRLTLEGPAGTRAEHGERHERTLGGTRWRTVSAATRAACSARGLGNRHSTVLG